MSESTAYHCFRWQGRCELMRDPLAQSDPTSAVPPGDVSGWRGKPPTLLVNSHADPESALDWLWHQMRHITLTTHQCNPQWPVVDIAADYAELRAELLGPDRACEWMFRLPAETCFLAAIVGVPNRA